jgi:hypothetical protein
MPRPETDNRLKQLLEAMTLEQKIGRMILASAGRVVPGPKDMAAIRAGRIGASSDLWRAAETRKAQRVAVEDRHRLS